MGNSKKKGIDINDLNSAKSQNAMVKMLSKNKTPLTIVLILVLNYFVISVLTYVMFFSR